MRASSLKGLECFGPSVGREKIQKKATGNFFFTFYHTYLLTFPGGSRGSDRSVRSSRREVDDLALSNILGRTKAPAATTYTAPTTPNYSSSYGRKDIDDMVSIVST